jgi:hypothetical protein
VKARTTAWQLRNFITAAVSSAAAVALILAIPLLSCRTGPHPQFKPDFGQGGGLANLTIAVSTPEGSPLANAPVYFGGTQFTTDADGRIAIGKVGRGTYEVACDHPDFMYYSTKVDIPVGDYTLDIELARSKGEFAVERILPGLGDATPYQNGTFVIEFNRQLDATSAEASRFEFDPPLGDCTVSVSGSTLTLSFLREWRAGQTVRWKILKGIKSADGGELTISYVGQFRVSPVDLTPPKLVSSTPPDGAVNVFRNQKITLFFSDALDAESLAEGALTLTPETQISTTVADNSLMITFDGLLAANTAYTLVLASLHDMNGNALQQPVTLKFTTGTRTRQFSYRNADWTRIGDRIAFESDEDGGFDIWEIKADGTELRKLTSNSADD